MNGMKSAASTWQTATKNSASAASDIARAMRSECIEGTPPAHAHRSCAPAALSRTRGALIGKPLSAETVRKAASLLAKEISPISDARGSANYKSLLLRQLFFAHFLELFPERFTLADLL